MDLWVGIHSRHDFDLMNVISECRRKLIMIKNAKYARAHLQFSGGGRDVMLDIRKQRFARHVVS